MSKGIQVFPYFKAFFLILILILIFAENTSEGKWVQYVSAEATLNRDPTLRYEQKLCNIIIVHLDLRTC